MVIAAANGHAEMTSALLAKGAHVNYADTNGDTALICAAINGETEVVKLLIDGGADKTMKTRGEYKTMTARDYALHFNHPSVVALLQ